MCKYLEGMHTLSEWVFSMMLQNHAWLKDPLKFQQITTDFSVIEYEKLIEMALDSTVQIIFKKLKLENFGIVPKKNIHNYLKRLLKCFPILQLQIRVSPDFLSTLQWKQNITTD